MGKYQIGRISGTWINFTPPIRGGVFRHNLIENINSGSNVTITTNAESGCPSDPVTRSRSPSNGSKSTSTASQPGVGNTAAVEQAFDVDVKDYPSVDRGTQQRIVRKYRELHNKVKREGYYHCQYKEYAKELSRYVTIFAIFLVSLRAGWYITSAAFLGLFWVRDSLGVRQGPLANIAKHQIMFTAHDAGHRGITHNYVVDSLIGMFIADFCCGLSIGWWKSSHNVHHLVTNHHVSTPPPV